MTKESESNEDRFFARRGEPSKVQKVLQFRTLVLSLARGLIELGDTGTISESVRRDCADALSRQAKRGK